jgi:hypothetical protein
MFEKIERFVFFPLVRVTAVITASVVLLAMIGGLIFFFSFNGIKKEDNISFLEVRNKIYPESPVVKDGKQVKVPRNVKKYFEDGFMRYLDGWLNNMETEQEKAAFLKSIDKKKELSDYSSYKLNEWLYRIETVQEKNAFLKNLSKIIAEARKNDPENIDEYIDSYIYLYHEKANGSEDILGLGKLIGPEALSKLEQGINSVITSLIKGIVGFSLLFLFLLFTITIVLLSLLSIERNTRKELMSK